MLENNSSALIREIDVFNTQAWNSRKMRDNLAGFSLIFDTNTIRSTHFIKLQGSRWPTSRISTHYKIPKIVRALWLLAERRVCIRVCKHGCNVKMFCFSCTNHASTNLKKVLSWKTRQVYFIYPFSRRLKLERSLETCCVNFFSLELTF